MTDLNVSDNWVRDLAALGLLRRRFHDTKRTFISLVRERGAIDSILHWVTHGPTAKQILDVYSSPDWRALCREVSRLKARLRTGKVVQLPATKVATHGGYRVQRTEETKETECPGRDSNSPGASTPGGAPRRFGQLLAA